MFRATLRPSGRAPLAVRSLRAEHRTWSIEMLEERALLSLEGNMLFPADSPWNRTIAAAPLAANSTTLVNSIGASTHVHPDFGTIWEGAYIGIPFNVVSAGHPLTSVVIDAYADESDIVPVPIPAGAIIEGDPLPSGQNDGDRHLIVYDKDANIVYELFNVHRPSETADGRWHADSEAVWRLDENWFRTPGDTSADAAGLPILPGLVRPDEVLDQGVINHALRFTVPNSRNQYVFPASHHAGSNNTSYPRMGERFRLKAGFDISGFSPANRVILQALKTYGMIVADNGSGWYISGQPSSRWDDDELGELKDIPGSSFEAVDLRPIATTADQTSGWTLGGTAVTLHGRNFSGNAGMLKVFFGATQAAGVTIVSDTVLVATSPAHAAGTVNITVQTPYGTSPAATGARFTFVAGGAAVVGRWLFYNQSAFDGNNALITAADDAAIATDKAAYRAGTGLSSFAAVSSYSRGINGLMIDLAGSGTHASISAADFVFKIGNNNSPGGWTAAPGPAAVSVRAGAGTSGSDRVEITWASGAIDNTWLQVTVLPNSRTGLAASDVFYWGSKVGDIGDPTPQQFTTTAAGDALPILSGVGPAGGITDELDIDRSNTITAAGDRAAANSNVGAIARIDIADGEGAEDRADDEVAALSAIAAALAAPAGAPTVAAKAAESPVLIGPQAVAAALPGYLRESNRFPWEAELPDIDSIAIDEDVFARLLSSLIPDP